RILDSTGKPFRNGDAKPRPELNDALARLGRGRRLEALYDAASASDEYKNIWANADLFDADVGNSKAVRQKLVPRARYEANNNGYLAGMLATYANAVVGIGPTLRMLAGTPAFNRAVETLFGQWTEATEFARKLWTLAHAKAQDGEGFAVLGTNP